jgi:hypothetical protein
MIGAVDRLFAVLDDASQRGRPPMADLLAEQALVEWAHYPTGDLFDPGTGIQIFYHAHQQGDRPSQENGHFHCFVERSRILGPARPLVNPKADGSRELCHIVGLSIDPRGVPFEAFTINQWVTDEWLYPAETVSGLLPAFAGVGDDAPIVLRWLSALVTLFEPQIEDLLIERDARLEVGRRGLARRARAQTHEITSSRALDVDAQIAAIEGLEADAP